MGLVYLLYILECLNGNCTGGDTSAVPKKLAVDAGGANVGTIVQKTLF